MGKTETMDYPRGLTFEKVWAALKETDRIVQENAKRQAETDRQLKETMKETMKETDRQIKEFNKRFGDFTNCFGEMVEHMVAPNLRKEFAELGLIFPKANHYPAGRRRPGMVKAPLRKALFFLWQ